LKDDLLSWLEHARGEYARRKKSAEAKVVQWQWSTSSDRELEPLYFERNRLPRGRRLPTEPSVIKEGYVAYGLDAGGRVVVERSYAGIVDSGGRWFYETFYEYSTEQVEWVRYDYAPDKSPIAVHRANFAGERILSLVMRGKHGGSSERYIYDDSRIIEIARDAFQPSDPRPHLRTWSDRFDIHWDGLGRVEKITRSDSDGSRPSTIFQRPDKGQTLKGLLAAIEPKLVEQVQKCAAALRLKEPAYSLVLAYDGEGNDMLPPVIGIGLERERRQWMSERAEDAKWLLWNPAEYQHYDREPLSLTDAELRTLCDKANQEISMKEKWSAGRSLLDRVTASLRSFAWKSVLPITDDFVVFVVDFELSTLHQSLRKAAGARRFRSWLRDGLIP
jgi:hypothetical protein